MSLFWLQGLFRFTSSSFSISSFEYSLLRRRRLLLFLFIFRFLLCVWRLFIFSLNIFFLFFRHIERKCKIFLFRFYLNVAFGILSLTKEIPSENKIFSVSHIHFPFAIVTVVCSINLNDR